MVDDASNGEVEEAERAHREDRRDGYDPNTCDMDTLRHDRDHAQLMIKGHESRGDPKGAAAWRTKVERLEGWIARREAVATTRDSESPVPPQGAGPSGMPEPFDLDVPAALWGSMGYPVHVTFLELHRGLTLNGVGVVPRPLLMPTTHRRPANKEQALTALALALAPMRRTAVDDDLDADIIVALWPVTPMPDGSMLVQYAARRVGRGTRYVTV